MATTPKFGFKIYTPTDNVSSADLTRLRRITSTQLAALLSLVGPGVIDDGSGDALLAEAGAGLEVTVEVGAANVLASDTSHYGIGATTGIKTVSDLADERDDDAPLYIHAGLVEGGNSGEDADPVAPDSIEGTAQLNIFASDNESEAGAILLAEVTTADGAVATVTDRRAFIPLSQLQGIVDAIGMPYDPDALGGTIKARLAAIETRLTAIEAALGAATGEVALTLDTISVSATDSTKGKAYVDAIKSALEAAIAGGGTVIRENPELKRVMEELASLDLGLTEIHREHARRSRATRVVIGVEGDGSAGSSDDLIEGTATVYDDEQLIGPGAA